jgi:predicted dehydrogenase
MWINPRTEKNQRMADQARLSVAMIGYGFMGAAHSQGWRVAPRFFDLGAKPSMELIVGRNATAVAEAADKWGWAESGTDWREAIARDDIDIIDIVTPGDSHAEIAIAALEAGKHVLCEKPLANTVDEASAMAEAAARAAENGVFAMVGFTYRRVPAATLARDLVAAGKIGDLYQVRQTTSRIGSPTQRSRSPGGCKRNSPVQVRSGISAPTQSTSRNLSPVMLSQAFLALSRPLSRSAPCSRALGASAARRRAT